MLQNEMLPVTVTALKTCVDGQRYSLRALHRAAPKADRCDNDARSECWRRRPNVGGAGPKMMGLCASACAARIDEERAASAERLRGVEESTRRRLQVTWGLDVHACVRRERGAGRQTGRQAGRQGIGRCKKSKQHPESQTCVPQDH